jgi:hypothetical protein
LKDFLIEVLTKEAVKSSSAAKVAAETAAPVATETAAPAADTVTPATRIKQYLNSIFSKFKN